MLRIRFVTVLIYICLINYSFSSRKRKQGRFEVNLEYVQICPHPNPPYKNETTLVSHFYLHPANGKKFISGSTNVTMPTAFHNFSGRTYAIDSNGHRVLKFKVSEVTCRNIFAKSILMFSNIHFCLKSCMLSPGSYRYDIDLDKITHAIPSWHAPGDILHELQLVTDGLTEACAQVAVKIS